VVALSRTGADCSACWAQPGPARRTVRAGTHAAARPHQRGLCPPTEPIRLISPTGALRPCQGHGGVARSGLRAIRISDHGGIAWWPPRQGTTALLDQACPLVHRTSISASSLDDALFTRGFIWRAIGPESVVRGGRRGSAALRKLMVAGARSATSSAWRNARRSPTGSSVFASLPRSCGGLGVASGAHVHSGFAGEASIPGCEPWAAAGHVGRRACRSPQDAPTIGSPFLRHCLMMASVVLRIATGRPRC
jgi:hypothetical protein